MDLVTQAEGQRKLPVRVAWVQQGAADQPELPTESAPADGQAALRRLGRLHFQSLCAQSIRAHKVPEEPISRAFFHTHPEPTETPGYQSSYSEDELGLHNNRTLAEDAALPSEHTEWLCSARPVGFQLHLLAPAHSHGHPSIPLRFHNLPRSPGGHVSPFCNQEPLLR